MTEFAFLSFAVTGTVILDDAQSELSPAFSELVDNEGQRR